MSMAAITPTIRLLPPFHDTIFTQREELSIYAISQHYGSAARMPEGGEGKERPTALRPSFLLRRLI